MNLRPTAAPARQLIAMLWAETEGRGQLGLKLSYTYRLLRLGLVESVDRASSFVCLTEAGRIEARRLMETPEGQAYMAEAGVEE